MSEPVTINPRVVELTRRTPDEQVEFLMVKIADLQSEVTMLKEQLQAKQMCDDCGKKPAVNHTCYRCGLPDPTNDGHF